MKPTIAVVGGGVSGCLTVIQLLRSATTPIDIHLIERSGVFGKGIAYGTREYSSLLNVPAGKMSAFPDDPKHFLRWLHKINFCDTQGQLAIESSFVPRAIYGRYIAEVLNTAEIEANSCVQLIRHHDTVLDIDACANSALLYLQSGEQIHADKVVLAFGNFPPRDLPCMNETVRSSPRYVANPWVYGAFDQIPADESVLVIGTGLTMVDTVLTLHAHGHRGQMVAVSKHGLLPQPHRLSPNIVLSLDIDKLPMTARALLRHIRQHFKTVTQVQNVDWRIVFDSLRPITTAIWERLPLEEKRRLLRHAQPYWDIHRHRMPPEAASIIEHLRTTDQLVIQQGYLKRFEANENSISAKIENISNGQKMVHANWVINCTGTNSDYSTLTDPLIMNLFERGLIRSDCLRLGLDAYQNGALRDISGNISNVLYTLGSPLKGILWETTAVPEIRTQAVQLAQTMLSKLVFEDELMTH